MSLVFAAYTAAVSNGAGGSTLVVRGAAYDSADAIVVANPTMFAEPSEGVSYARATVAVADGQGGTMTVYAGTAYPSDAAVVTANPSLFVAGTAGGGGDGTGFNLVTIMPSSPESLGTGLSNIAGFSDVASGAWPAANRAIFVPFVLRASFTVTQVLVLNGSSAAGNADAGVYDESGTRLASSGSTARSGTSAVQAFDFTDVPLSAGVYYMALALDGTTGQCFRWAPTVGGAAALGVLSQSSAFALPSTATFAAAADAYIPVMAVSGRSLV